MSEVQDDSIEDLAAKVILKAMISVGITPMPLEGMPEVGVDSLVSARMRKANNLFLKTAAALSNSSHFNPTALINMLRAIPEGDVPERVLKSFVAQEINRIKSTPRISPSPLVVG